MYIIYLALAFALIFYSIDSITRMIKTISRSGFLAPVGSGYGGAWFASIVILNITVLIAIIIYYMSKRHALGKSGPKGYDGTPGDTYTD